MTHQDSPTLDQQSPSPLLQVNGLKTYFQTSDGLSKAVDDVSFSLYSKETLGLVGESGCGKSVTVMTIMRLLPMPPAIIAGGEIVFDNESLLSLSEEQMQTRRGKKMAMIFQEPMTSLNPVQRCGEQISEVLQWHLSLSKRAAKERSIELLRKVGIYSPEKRFSDYPHQLSGGMRQRVMIAMALACNPLLLLADEPTTALDVTVQAQILDLIISLQHEFGMGVILITHDLAVVKHTCHKVVIMYASKVVEIAKTKDIFSSPLHPYTQGLLKSIPTAERRLQRLYSIEGTVPLPYNYPKGCHFCTRCEFADSRCWEEKPPLEELEKDHFVACWKAKEIASR